MIKLDVEDYCQECPFFEPMLSAKPSALFADGKIYMNCGDYIIRYKRYGCCKRMYNLQKENEQ